MGGRRHDNRLGALIQVGGWVVVAVATPAFVVNVLYLLVVVLEALFLGGGGVLSR